MEPETFDTESGTITVLNRDSHGDGVMVRMPNGTELVIPKYVLGDERLREAYAEVYKP